MKSIIVRLQYVYRSLKRLGQPHLGMKVFYKGETCVLTQGVSDPFWNLSSIATSQRYHHVHISECRMDTSLSGKWRAFKSAYNFRMDYWYSIDLRKAGL